MKKWVTQQRTTALQSERFEATTKRHLAVKPQGFGTNMCRLCSKGLMMSVWARGCAMRVQPGRVCKTRSRPQLLSHRSHNHHLGIVGRIKCL